MKKKKITVLVISIAVALTVTLSLVPSIAKYITTQSMKTDLDSDHFYFSSDYLRSDETPVYEILGNSVTFDVRNYADSLRINGTDIIYTATSTDGSTVSTSTGTLTGGALSKSEITLSYSFQGDEQQKDITVTVRGTGTYTGTLQAKFIFIRPTDKLKYYIEDTSGSNYAVLYICATEANKAATLSWNIDELLIDETNDYIFDQVENNLETKTGSVTTKDITAGTTVKIVFFKMDLTKDYSKDITLSDDGTIKMPTIP